MAKVIKYKFLSAVINNGTEDNPIMEQILLNKTMGWNEINEEIAKKEAHKGEYTIEDAGYEKTNAEKIAELKAQLSATDYKVIKCSECQLAGKEMPYDVAELHAERQAIRDQINQLEQAE